jgi:hypothetical protein
MSSIIRDGDTCHGISVESRGVFTDTYGTTYAGQIRIGYACGLGVVTLFSGNKVYAEYGPDGWFDGRCLYRHADGFTDYILFERGKRKESANVWADGRCEYNRVACAPDDPRFLALIAQVGPVEVRPVALAPTRHRCPPLRPQAIVRWIGRLVLPPQALAKATATEVHPRRTPSLVAVRHNPTAAALYRAIVSPPEPSCRALQFSINPVSGLAGRGSRGQPATALGGARALRPPSSAGYSRGTEEAVTGCSRSTQGVL